MSMTFDMYMHDVVKPMRDELTNIGVTELRTPEAVDTVMSEKSGTMLLVFNSVCGCAAGQARPGVTLALKHSVIPDRLYTVFAGQDKAATAQARAYIPHIRPSSPSMALFKDGALVHFVPRELIEDAHAEHIANELTQAFDTHCR
jgi:putative YphP/YqiW family bacilliredoxin